MANFRIIAALLLLWLLPASLAQAQSCPQMAVNAQTGTTYTVLNSDNCKKVSFSNASAIAVTLPQAGSSGNFGNTWSVTLVNIGVGNVTVTPTTSTIDGRASILLQQGGSIQLTSNGTNYISSGIFPALSTSGLVDPDQLPIATTGATGAVRTGTCLEMGGAGSKVISVSASCRTMAITFIIDGGGSAITAGVKGDLQIPFDCTITAARLFLDQSGSIVVDIWKDTYANYPPTVADTITASAKPTVTTATKSEDATLTGWTTTIATGNTLRFNVDSITTATRATLTLTCVKS